MSNGFEERKTAAEAKFRHDEEFKFKVTARRNKMLGLWAASLMNIEGADAEAYAKQVVISDFDEPGDDDQPNQEPDQGPEPLHVLYPSSTLDPLLYHI